MAAASLYGPPEVQREAEITTKTSLDTVEERLRARGWGFPSDLRYCRREDLCRRKEMVVELVVPLNCGGKLVDLHQSWYLWSVTVHQSLWAGFVDQSEFYKDNLLKQKDWKSKILKWRRWKSFKEKKKIKERWNWDKKIREWDESGSYHLQYSYVLTEKLNYMWRS